MDTSPEHQGLLQRFVAVLDAITLTPEQQESDLATRRAKVRMWLNHCNDLELLDMAEKVLEAYVQREGRTVGGQAVAESEAQRRYIEYAEELRILTKKKNEQIRQNALAYVPPAQVIEVRPEPVRESTPQAPFALHPLATLSIMIAGTILIAFFSCILGGMLAQGGSTAGVFLILLLGCGAIYLLWKHMP